MTRDLKNITQSLIRRAGNKRGSYIVESAIVLPIFLIAVLAMSSIILMYACIEDCSFILANEMRRGAAEAIAADTSALIPARVRSQLTGGHSQVKSVRVTDYGYRVSRWGQDELIAINIRMTLGAKAHYGIRARADHDLSLVTRAYVGKVRDCPAMTDAEMSGNDADPVYIFPARGERYHDRGCGFLKAASTSGTLNSGLRKKYKPCPICGSRKASNGARVYYFPAAGEAYHLSGCSALSRNYVEIDKKDAVARGYTPCAKCGG